ncbi:metallophosphoesterase [Clostridium felsineum]|uniref:metallophosphoesterase n=1 Tax=Clostridium felsineum TaxID=36839 RepID=UPI00214D392F|nr:metallophosphoesterase [Clostridium felsineum]MCR3759689.1 metallophosphoesterase [Clostridium felsineum]
MKTIFISDTHIGQNTPENWYQKSVHEKYLKAILQYVQSNAEDIQDVVILGDWFDLWMYTPQPQISATLNNIINNNLNVFTKQSDGDFITCMDSIQGNLYYVHGNHDMNIDFNQVNKYFAPLSSKNKQVICTDRIYGKNGIYAEHGHYYDTLCKPYSGKTDKYKPLPIGYFISRIAAWWCEKQLKKTGKSNSSELQNQGNPSANDFLTIIFDNDFYKIVFTMPDGTSIKRSEVLNLYPDLVTSWEAVTKLLTVDLNNCLDNYGANLCNDSYNGVKNKVVVMGHTHVPTMQQHLNSVYVNSGFMCPAVPDVSDGNMMMTFVEVDQNSSSYTVTIKKVNYPDTSIINYNQCTV